MQNSLDSVSIYIDKTDIFPINTQIQKLVAMSGISLATLAKDYSQLLDLIQTINRTKIEIAISEEY